MCADGLVLREDGTCAPAIQNKQHEVVVFQLNFRLTPTHDSQNVQSMYDLMMAYYAQFNFTIFHFINFLNQTLCHISIDVVFKKNKTHVYTELASTELFNVWDHIDFLDTRVELLIHTHNSSETFKAAEYIENYFLSKKILTIEGYKFNVGVQAVKTKNRYLYFVRNIDKMELALANRSALSWEDKFRFLRHGYDNVKNKFVVPYWIESLLNSDRCLGNSHAIELWPRPFTPRIKLPLHQREKVLHYLSYKNLTVHLKDQCPEVTSYNEIDILICEDNYISAFSDLVKESYTDASYSDYILSYLSLVCISLSVVFLLLTLSVYAIIPTLRTFPGLNNIGLATSLLLYQIFYLISHSKGVANLPWLCLTSAAFVHFFLLVYTFWMLLGTYFSTKAFNTSYRSKNRHAFCKFVQNCVLVIVLSSGIVLGNVVYSRYFTDEKDFGYATSPCYIKTLTMKIFTVALPVGQVITANIIMFTMTAVSFCRLPNMNSVSNQHFQKLKVLLKLSSITGASWVFGFLHQLTAIKVFAYSFITLNAGSGVLIFVSFIVTRRVWTMLKKRILTGRNISSELTKSTQSKSFDSNNRKNL